jgi:iron(III) transport system substrate-binding protein
MGLVASLAAACGKGDGRTVLTVYSPHGKTLLQHYELAFERAHPNVDVQWVDMGSQEVLDRVRAEKANPQGDLWFGAPSDAFAKAARSGLLQPYRPTWAAVVDPSAHDSADQWYGTYLTPEVIAYNTDRVSPQQAPKDWDDVLDPKWKGRIIIRDPVASGSMRAIFGGMIARAAGPAGSSEAGYAWLRRLDANTREYAFNPAILFEKLKRGEEWITLYNMHDIATLRQTGAPIAYVLPTSGTPLLVDAIALVKGAKHPEIAKQFYEFVTTPEALQFAADSLLRIPARTDLPLDRLPAWIREAKTSIKPLAVDERLMADSLDAWMRYWDANIRNRNNK